MEMEDRYGGKTTLSLLEREDLSCGKFISRQSSVGFSSRIYYRSAEGVPFKWEMRPGKSACQPEEEIIPLPSPSPAMQSLDLPKPSPRLLVENKKKSIRSKMDLLLSWKKMKKIVDRKAKTIKNRGNDKFDAIPCSCSDNKLDRFEFYSSDGESYESSPKSTSSSSSSRFSTVENNVVCERSLRCPSSATARNFLIPFLSCTPWKLMQGVSSVHAPRHV